MNTIQSNSDIKLSINPQEQKQGLQSDQEKCPICLFGEENGPLARVSHRTTTYFHKFHLNCINPWISLGHRDCPSCKEPMKALHIATNPSSISDDEEQPLISREHVIEIQNPLNRSLMEEVQQAPYYVRIAWGISGAVCVGGLFVAGWFYQQIFSHMADLTNHH